MVEETLARRINYASNTQITFFLTRSQLAELEALNPYKTTIGEILELAFSDIPPDLLELAHYPWFYKKLREARPVDLYFAFNFIRHQLSLFFAAQQHWRLVRLERTP